MTATVRAAGGVVVRGAPDHVELLLVHRPRYDDWTFPKGKVDRGETDLDAARREVAEETGLQCEPVIELVSTSYVDNRRRAKTVRYWLMTVNGGAFEPNREVDRIAWVGPDEAAAMLTYAHDLAVLHDATARLPR